MTTLRRSNALRSKTGPEMSMSIPTPIPIPMPMSHSILEHVHSYEDSSQYNRDGTSSLLAALSFARIVFSMEQSGLRDTALLQAVMTRECAEEATAICALWSRSFHLDVEDISLFEKTLKLKTSTYGFPGVFEFISLLTELSNIDSSAVATITLHPETIACLKLQVAAQSVFIIFDSHPSSFYTNGTGMIASTLIEDTASRLTELLRITYFTNSFLHRQITNYSGHVTHVFVPHYDKASTLTLSQAALEPGFAQLSMRAEVSDSRYSRLQNVSLRGEVEAQNQRQRRQTQRQEQWQLGSSSGPSKFFDQPSATPRYFSSSTRRLPHPPSSITSISIPNHFGPDFTSAGSSSIHAFPPIPPSSRDNELDSFLLAMRLQHEFDNEDRTLSAQCGELTKSTQQLFMCGICLEEMSNDFIVRPDPCGHTFCRECLHEHVTTRLNDRRFPILCPSCAASNGKGKGSAGEISQSLALNLGLNDEQYNIWTEMEMAAFAVLLHCRKCQRTMFVVRDEHDETNIITCPLPDCNHAWCKQCQQSVDLINDPEHSCDGTSELDHLMKQQGWKYCPTCKTPIQKSSGCNHMTCGTPGCNTDFCYGCGGIRGDLIVRPAFPQAIGAARALNCQCID